MGNDFHGTPLIISWLALANLTVLAASFRWTKYSFFIHLFLVLVIIGLTLGATIQCIQGWLPDPALILPTDDQSTMLNKLHQWVGMVFVCSLSLLVIFGLSSRFIKKSVNIHPNYVIWYRRIHMITSYILILMAKFQYTMIQIQEGGQIEQFVILIVVDCICIAFYLMIKFYYYTLSEVITNSAQIQNVNKNKNIGYTILRLIKQYFIPKSPLKYQKKQFQIQTYNSQDQIQLSNYVIFNDYVYTTEPIQRIHPGGAFLIKNTNKRQIDRFIYGASPFQLLPEVKIPKHTKNSLIMCGQPLAKIERTSPMVKLKPLSKVTVSKCKKIANNSSTYILYLRLWQDYEKQSQQTTRRQLLSQYVGYNDRTQFGQYFTLSLIKNKNKISCTRLYTTIWSMRAENIQFMEKAFPILLQFQSAKVINNIQSKQMYSLNEKYQSIPLVIKRYSDGQFTSKLFQNIQSKQFIISRPMGKGLDYLKTKPFGKVIFISGGTGILPFCDFIDILFKRAKYLQRTSISSILADRDPLIKQDFVEKRQF